MASIETFIRGGTPANAVSNADVSAVTDTVDDTNDVQLTHLYVWSGTTTLYNSIALVSDSGNDDFDEDDTNFDANFDRTLYFTT